MPSTISRMRNGQMSQSQQIPQAQQPQNNEYLNSLKMMMHSANPGQFIAQLAAANPQVKQVVQMIQGGANPQRLFENMARQRGLDPNEVINEMMR